jgi:hypothetical protein
MYIVQYVTPGVVLRHIRENLSPRGGTGMEDVGKVANLRTFPQMGYFANLRFADPIFFVISGLTNFPKFANTYFFSLQIHI